MNVVILIAGIAGLAAAGYGLFTLGVDAVRRGQYVDIAVAAAVCAAVVALLVLYGDGLVR